MQVEGADLGAQVALRFRVGLAEPFVGSETSQGVLPCVGAL